ncbi:MAG: hypothetical protein DWQ01_06650 [Planctomycetota bacterium]|nr:MAG: hypothetical protein DWQ01_06650 [Planctomycetota bacterium]
MSEKETSIDWQSLRQIAFVFSLGSGLCLLAMLLSGLTHGGVTQQHFEAVFDLDLYHSELKASEAGLRWFLLFDNAFVIFYTGAFVLSLKIFQRTGKHPLAAPALAGMLLTAALDFGENVHMLVALQQVHTDVPLSMGEISLWTWLSLMKWHAAYLGLFLLSFVVPGTTALELLLRWSLRLALVPIGLVLGALPPESVPALELGRYGLMLIGMFVLAAIHRSPRS